MATTTDYFNSAGNFNWHAPLGVANVVVQGWGGGGAGAGRTTNGQGGGGGGGAFSQLNNFAAVAGNNYAITVGAGGQGNGTGTAGGNTTFNSTSLKAVGGDFAARNSATGAAGGLASSGVGDVKSSGGNGATGNATIFGGGGGAAGCNNTTNGADASGNTGGTGAGSGGSGGNGAKNGSAVGVAGTAPGGGGGGASRNSTTNRVGGNGATGRLSITYDYTPNAISLDGSTQYGKILTSSQIAALNGTFTMEGWFYLDRTAAAFAYAMHIASSTVTTGALQLENGTGNEGCNFESNYSGASADGFASSGVFTQGFWVHVAMVATLNQPTKIYRFGSEISYNLQQTPTGTVQDPTGHDFYIGKDGKAVGPNWKGRIGGFVRVWNTARTPTQLTDNMLLRLQASNETGLIINCNFTEGSGTTVANEADGTKNMALTGTPPWVSGPGTSAKSYTSIKTVLGLAKASVKTWNGLAIASVKTANGLA